MENFKPHLAGKVDFSKLVEGKEYWASPKVDALRAVNVNGTVLSRTLKAFPNHYVQRTYSLEDFRFFDGELVVGEAVSPNVYLNSYSGIMKQDGEPEVTWCVFDYFKHPSDPYEARYRAMQDAIAALPDELALRLTLLVQEPVVGREAVEVMETTMLATGFEGLMLRDPTKPYKFGRSSNSEKDSALLKLKRMESGEARIVGFECEYENTNEATLDERGYTKRSTHKENKVPKDTLGRVFVKDVVSGVEFAIGVFRGYTKADLKVLWDHRDDLLGKIVTYDYFGIGAYSAPRHPVMKGFRDKIDFGG